jgi:hypothetical protein
VKPTFVLGLATLALGAAHDVATAESCSGGSSDSGSSSSDSDGGGDSDSTPACVDTIDVHGHRQCTRFGRWGQATRRPGIVVELGTAVRQFASPLTERTGTIDHDGESFQYRVVSPTRRALDTAVVAQMRVALALRHGFYAGLEFEAGALTDSSASAEMASTGESGRPNIEQTSVGVLGGQAVAGFRTRLGRASLGIEAAGGFRALTYNYESTYGDCETTTAVLAVGGMVEGRARASYWLSPFVTIGVTAGKSLTDDAWMGGIFLGAHTRAFGGH